MIWDPLERLLWGVEITISFCVALVFINRARQRTNHDEKNLLYGSSSIFLGIVLDRTFRYISDFFIKG